MRVSRSSLAEQAAECLVALCAGREVPIQKKRLHSTWIEGASLSPPPD
jgi:DNA-binding LacI/PurR family transcriptional regulator